MAWNDYRAIRALSPKTLKVYQSCLNLYLSDWCDLPIDAISKDFVEQRHRLISEKCGPTVANLAMRFLSAIFNFALAKYENSVGESILKQNPVKRISQVRAWNRESTRKRYIKPHELDAWLRAAMSLSDIKRDFPLLLLFTGFRKKEGLTLKWDYVDFQDRTITLPITKNRRAHVLPMSDFVFDMLQKRYQCRRPDAIYVFPAMHSIDAHAQYSWPFPKAIIKRSGIEFSLHDLRRTFVSIGHGLGLSTYVIKQLVNHSPGTDQTARYICLSVEHLRDPVQQIADFILDKHGLRTGLGRPLAGRKVRIKLSLSEAKAATEVETTV